MRRISGNPFRWYDLVVLGILAVVYYLVHDPFVHHGMPWADTSWYFHFGRRILHGAVPYRDFIFQVGPLPITVDAIFQRLFGETYQSSIFAAIVIKYCRVAVLYLLIRCFTSPVVAIGILTYCTFDHSWAFTHHWGTPYVDLFALTSALFGVLAFRNEAGRRRDVFLFLAGGSLALVMLARQSNGIVMTMIALAVTTIFAIRDWPLFTKRNYLRVWAGYAGTIALFLIVMLALGALRPTLQQMFFDAGQKKTVTATVALAEALSGGGLTHYKLDPKFTPLSGLIYFNLAPFVVVAFVFLAIANTRARGSLSGGGIALAAIPFALIVRYGSPYTTLDFQIDVPRIFATLAIAFAVLAPDRTKRMFGVEPEIVAWLLGLPLGIAWAMEMSFPGRGWSDGASLPTAIFVIMAASKRVSHVMKACIAVALGIVGTTTFVAQVKQDVDPFVAWGWADGKVPENHVMTGNPRLRGIRYNEPRSKVLAWLTDHVKPGDSCFVYGNMPVLYDLLDCKNPSALDTTAADFFTAKDGNSVVAALHRSPPKWIIAQERHWMNPDLELAFIGDDGIYAGLNPPASKVLHLGLRDLLPKYTPPASSKEWLSGEDLTYLEKLGGEEVHRIRLYKLRERATDER